MLPTSITSVLIDDDSQALDILEVLLQDIEGMEIKSKCNKSTEALPCIIKHKPDIIFLDIDMPEKDGIELAKDIRDKDIDTSIVFITAYNEHAIEAFKVAAFDYILKPIDPAELKNTIERLKQSRTKYDLSEKIDKLARTLAPEKLRFNTRNGYIMLNPNDIVYCEADGNYTFLHLHNDTAKHVTQQIGKVYQQLDPGIFLRINRSVIVNRNSIVSFNRLSRKMKLYNAEGEIEFRVAREVVRELY